MPSAKNVTICDTVDFYLYIRHYMIQKISQEESSDLMRTFLHKIDEVSKVFLESGSSEITIADFLSSTYDFLLLDCSNIQNKIVFVHDCVFHDKTLKIVDTLQELSSNIEEIIDFMNTI